MTHFGISCRTFTTTSLRAAPKKKHWAAVANMTSNADRALEHFDDFYGSVYAQKWPSMRLGLLCPPKFVAVPNNFSDVDEIVKKLEGLGAYNLHSLWERGKEILKGKEAEVDSTEEDKRLRELDKTLEVMARTKKAEEMDALYQNAPTRKIPGIIDTELDRRVIRDVGEAAAEFIPPTKLIGIEGFDFESEYYSYYHQDKIDQNQASGFWKFTTTSNAPKIPFPFIRPFIFEGGSTEKFPPAQKSSADLRDWLCVNGASLAPVIALDLKPGLNVLDLCAAPGPKSLLIYMTMCAASLTLNDIETNRLGRIKRLFQEFTGNAQPSDVLYQRQNAVHFPASPDYSRILIDVPCSSDRVSATISENSLFNPRRLRERLNLVKIQKSILLSGFKCLLQEPGSVCVYSTCTLSPIENDGTVGTALRETDVQNLVVDVEGLWEFLLPLQVMNLLRISRTKFGVLVEPNVFSNCGPMYVSRILCLPSPPPPKSA